MSLTVGIDPGNHITGYGVLEHEGSDISYVASGVIRIKSKPPRAERLIQIKRELDRILAQYRPSSAAVENIFIAHNPRTALALGEARGVVLLAVAEAGIPVFEYSPREVKSSVVGQGGAHKSQVAAMILKFLKIEPPPVYNDETDALAVAFCHALRDSGFRGRLT
ncbi:MAG: crossover junction endodeoxyribonuclease RuvC [Candidatus Krumholzibacteriota bacterium]|nr:crossover junction endodeoxyribonuclease RuvC [Candidatus Krumholzibacteriota bacterium]